MEESINEIRIAGDARRARQSLLGDLIVRLIKEKPLGIVGAVIVLGLFTVGITADFLAPYRYDKIHLRDALNPPSSTYLLGTDDLGRDLLSRIIYGARISMVVGLAGSTVATAISVFIGLVSGFFGGKVDLAIQRFVDAWMSFPGIFLMLSVVAVLGAGLFQVIVVLSLLYGIGGSRIVRGAVLGIKENMYISAAIAVGCSPSRLLIKHILPNVMAPIIILFTTRMASMIILEATMSFLGFGIPPPTPTWGGMLSGSGRRFMLKAPWLVLWPGLILSIVVYGINMLGDAIRDLLDPRLRGTTGGYGVKRKKKPGRK